MWKYSSYWYTSFDEMAEKTMIRQLLSKWGILTTEMAQAMDADMAVINEDGTKDYVDSDADVIDTEETAPNTYAPSEEPQPEEPEQVKGQTSLEKDFPESMPDNVQQDAASALFGK